MLLLLFIVLKNGEDCYYKLKTAMSVPTPKKKKNHNNKKKKKAFSNGSLVGDAWYAASHHHSYVGLRGRSTAPVKINK